MSGQGGMEKTHRGGVNMSGEIEDFGKLLSWVTYEKSAVERTAQLYGGLFVQKLVEALMIADSTNVIKIATMWSIEFQHLWDLHRQLKKD